MNMSETLTQILERFKSKVAYRNTDKTALDMSRAADAGNLYDNDKNYAQWALISNDPLVIINYVKSFITTLSSKLASAPLRPEDDKLNEVCLGMRLNAMGVEMFRSTLADGYNFLGFGLDNDEPTCSVIDARSIMFNGNDPTLKDATEVVVFDVLPRERDDDFTSEFPIDYVDFDPTEEKVRTSYYYKKGGKVNLDVYEEGKDKPTHYEFPNLDRIPVVRFYGERFELTDKRWHYRGLYYQFASIIKAATMTATKIQIRNATSDDDNYMVAGDAIANSRKDWNNVGAKIFDHTDANGNQIEKPVIPIEHDNQFLVQSMELWKSIISDMLGPVVQSNSEAVTREEVIARNEVRDAIANIYLSYIANSMSECYRIVSMLKGWGNKKVVVQGGFLEETQRSKKTQEIVAMYNLAKESGLNSQGFVMQILVSSSLDQRTKDDLAKLLLSDPFASPLVQQLKTQVQQLTLELQKAQQREAILRTMASQRLERQAEWVAAQKEIKRNELTLKQWQQEDKDTQEARMELMRSFIQQGDTASALALLDQIKQTDPAVALNPTLDAMGTEDLQTMTSSARKDVDNVAGNSEFHPGQQPQGQPTGPAVPSGAGQPWTPRVVSIPTTNPARPGPQQ
jgi:hypothetical protein